jgi:uncharacterized membrane protein YdcZ (DUF606 family)
MTNEPEQSEGGQSELEHVQSQVNEAMAKLSGPGEPLIALAAVLLLFVDVVGDIIMQDYSFTSVAWISAVLIVIAIVAVRFGNAELPVTYGTLLATLALVAGLVIARQLISDLRFERLDRGGATVFFALVSYAAGVVALVGAWQVWGSMSKDS